MRRGYLYIAGVVVALAFVAASGEVSIRTATCMVCHQREASFAHWMGGRLKTEKKGFGHELIACADCHIKGAPANTVMSRMRALLHAGMYLVPQIDPLLSCFSLRVLVKNWALAQTTGVVSLISALRASHPRWAPRLRPCKPY